MTDKTAITITPSLIATATRILTESGKFVTDGIGFAAPPEPFGVVIEHQDGTFTFEKGGSLQEPGDFKASTLVWSDLKPAAENSCAETSPEVAEIAARGISDPKSLSMDEVKSVCASALAQTAPATEGKTSSASTAAAIATSATTK